MHEFFEFKAKRLDGYDDLLCFDELSPAERLRLSAKLFFPLVCHCRSDGATMLPTRLNCTFFRFKLHSLSQV